jgi:hypothetical protein
MRVCVKIGTALVLGWLVALPAVPQAAQPPSDGLPEWQFKTGQAWRWTFDQSVNMKVPQGEFAVKQILDFDVDVTSVEKDVATLALSTSRIRVVMDLPDGKTSYDSAAGKAAKNKGQNGEPVDPKTKPASKEDQDADDEAQKLSRDLMARMLAPVRNLKYSVTLDRHCVVQAVAIEKAVLDAFKSGPLQAFLVLLDKDGFSSGYVGGFIRMPADGRQADQTWRSKVVSSGNVGMGKGIFEHAIRRDGTAKIDGRDMLKFSSTVHMLIEENELTPFKLGKQTGTGAVYFDPQEGRISLSQWTLAAQVFLGGGKVEGEMKIETKSQISDRKKSE